MGLNEMDTNDRAHALAELKKAALHDVESTVATRERLAEVCVDGLLAEIEPLFGDRTEIGLRELLSGLSGHSKKFAAFLAVTRTTAPIQYVAMSKLTAYDDLREAMMMAAISELTGKGPIETCVVVATLCMKRLGIVSFASTSGDELERAKEVASRTFDQYVDEAINLVLSDAADIHVPEGAPIN